MEDAPKNVEPTEVKTRKPRTKVTPGMLRARAEALEKGETAKGIKRTRKLLEKMSALLIKARAAAPNTAHGRLDSIVPILAALTAGLPK